MTHLEFENLTGLVTDNYVYQGIEAMYMSSGDMVTKQDFCEDYKVHCKSLLLKTFYDQTQSLKEELSVVKTSQENTAHFLIHKSMEGGDQQMIDLAISILGKEEYLQYKIEKKLTFLTFDWDLTVTLINKK